MSPYRGGNTPMPPQPPVWIPAQLRHGTSYVYRYYKCRCRRCQEWRRSYDRERDDPVRTRTRQRVSGRSPWYVCVDEDSFIYSWHHYDEGTCVRCGAGQATEEFWERKWQGS